MGATASRQLGDRPLAPCGIIDKLDFRDFKVDFKSLRMLFMAVWCAYRCSPRRIEQRSHHGHHRKQCFAIRGRLNPPSGRMLLATKVSAITIPYCPASGPVERSKVWI